MANKQYRAVVLVAHLLSLNIGKDAPEMLGINDINGILPYYLPLCGRRALKASSLRGRQSDCPKVAGASQRHLHHSQNSKCVPEVSRLGVMFRAKA